MKTLLNGGTEQDQPGLPDMDAPQRDCRPQSKKHGSHEMSGRGDLRLSFAGHVQPKVGEGYVHAPDDKQETDPTGDREDQESRGLEERQRCAGLAIANPRHAGHTERHDRGNGVQHKVQAQFDVLATEHRQQDDGNGQQGEHDDRHRQDSVQSV